MLVIDSEAAEEVEECEDEEEIVLEDEDEDDWMGNGKAAVDAGSGTTVESLHANSVATTTCESRCWSNVMLRSRQGK